MLDHVISDEMSTNDSDVVQLLESITSLSQPMTNKMVTDDNSDVAQLLEDVTSLPQPVPSHLNELNLSLLDQYVSKLNDIIQQINSLKDMEKVYRQCIFYIMKQNKLNQFESELGTVKINPTREKISYDTKSLDLYLSKLLAQQPFKHIAEKILTLKKQTLIRSHIVFTPKSSEKTQQLAHSDEL
jgi:hypothetical protein